MAGIGSGKKLRHYQKSLECLNQFATLAEDIRSISLPTLGCNITLRHMRVL